MWGKTILQAKIPLMIHFDDDECNHACYAEGDDLILSH